MRQSLSVAFLVLLAGCARGGVPMAPSKSPYFDAVTAQLHLGGTVYAYADIDGDAARAADFMLTLLRDHPEISPARGVRTLSATALVRILGLDMVKAVGMSSFERGEELYHNRTFIHHLGARAGLLRAFGGEPAGFSTLDVAPTGADMIWEQQIDLGALLDVVRALGEVGVGITPEALDEALDQRFLELDVTLRQLVERADVTAALILALDGSRNLWFPGESVTFPFTDFLFRVDGMGLLADAIIERASSDPFIRSSRTKDWIVVSPAVRLPPPWNAYEPALVKELATGRLYVVSSPAFLRRCLDGGDGVRGDPDFTQAFAELPQVGNGLTYFSAEMTREMHAIVDEVLAAGGPPVAALLARFFLPVAGYPTGWVVRSEPDGLLFTSNTASSHKSTLVTLGALAVLPAVIALGASDGGASQQETLEEDFEPPF